MPNSSKGLLASFADFIQTSTYKSITGTIIAVVAFIVLAGTFLFDWVQVEPASLEHKTHISIASIAERSPASRRQIRPSDIVTKIGGIPVPTDSLESVQQLYSSVLNQVLQEGGNGVLIEVYRGQERSEINLPLPQYSNAFELDMPVDGNTEDIGLTLAVVEAQSLHNDEGASLSLMQVWLGGSDDIATLDLEQLSNGKSGFGAVRGLDRFLILVPLTALVLLVLAILYSTGRLPLRSAMRYILLVSFLLVLIPILWQVFSANNWRTYFKENYGSQRDATLISRNIVESYNLPTLAISAKVSRQPRNVDLVNATTFEMNQTHNLSQMQRLVSLAFLAAVISFGLVIMQEAGTFANPQRLWAFITIIPSLILLLIFVYVFIAQTFEYSLTDWGEEAKGAPPPLTKDVSQTFIGSENYNDLMTNQEEFYFRDSLVNTFFFTLFFLLACLFFGFLLAFLVDQRIQGEAIFRTIFLFPMSLSFVVTGTIWRWLFQPSGGINVLPQKISNLTIAGHHIFPEPLRLGAFDNTWMNNRTVLFGFEWGDAGKLLIYLGLLLLGFAAFNYWSQASRRTFVYLLMAGLACLLIYALGIWKLILPPLDSPAAELRKGYQVALSGVVIAATWQMSGYVMALFLAGIRGVPEDLREAARVDGCAEWQVYFYVILPSLRPVALSAIIILGHISLKIFDLVFAMAGPDNNQTIVPGILLYTKAFRGNRLASGSAVAIVMLVLVSVVIIPYLWSNLRREESR